MSIATRASQRIAGQAFVRAEGAQEQKAAQDAAENEGQHEQLSAAEKIVAEIGDRRHSALPEWSRRGDRRDPWSEAGLRLPGNAILRRGAAGTKGRSDGSRDGLGPCS